MMVVPEQALLDAGHTSPWLHSTMTSASSEKSKGSPVPAEVIEVTGAAPELSADGPYRLYKRRFLGLLGMVHLSHPITPLHLLTCVS